MPLGISKTSKAYLLAGKHTFSYRADAAQEDGPDVPDLHYCTHYGTPVVRVDPVPFFVEGADNVCQVWWHGGPSRDDVPEVVGEEVVVRLRREAVVARGFVLPESIDGLPDFVDGEGSFH